MRPYPRFGPLKSQLKREAKEYVIVWRRPAYRSVSPQWGKPEYLISGQGSEKHGSRWMAPKITPVVYASSTEAIALKEARQNFSHFGIKPRKLPRLNVALEIELQAVIDLTALLAVLSWPSLPELMSEDWRTINDSGQETLSQAVGRALFELGYEGIRVPSTQDARGHNLAMFPPNRWPESKLEIVGQALLDKWLA